MNNSERSLWIDNDEGLYVWWQSSGLSKREFIRQNRQEIDEVIRRVTTGIRATSSVCGHKGCTLRPGHIPGHTDR